MTVRRRAARRDGNEQEIIKALRAVGATVLQVSEKGAPDLLVGYRGETFLIEVKMPGKPLTPDQQDFHAAWRGSRVRVVEGPFDALAVIGLSPPAPNWTDADRAELLPQPRKARP